MLRIFRGERSAAPAAEPADEQSGQQMIEAPDQAVPADAPADGRREDVPASATPADAATPAAPPGSATPPAPPGSTTPPGPPAEPTTAGAPAAIAESPGFLARGRMRRRVRFLRAARELAYRDLGGLIFELHRFGRTNDEVVHAKLSTLGGIDTELRALQEALHEPQPLTVLRQAGVAACPRCAAIHGSADRYCPTCGLPARQDPRPIAGAHTAAAGTPPPGMPPGPPAPERTHPASYPHGSGQPRPHSSPAPPPAQAAPPAAESATFGARPWERGGRDHEDSDADGATEVRRPARDAQQAQRPTQGSSADRVAHDQPTQGTSADRAAHDQPTQGASADRAAQDQSTQAFETIPPAAGRPDMSPARPGRELP